MSKPILPSRLRAAAGVACILGSLAALQACIASGESAQASARTATGAQRNSEDTPSACTAQFDPVCGADGKVYGNACEAEVAKTAWSKDFGTCDDRDAVVLRPIDTLIPRVPEFEPDDQLVCAAVVVCGADGKLYGDPCAAARAKVEYSLDLARCGEVSIPVEPIDPILVDTLHGSCDGKHGGGIVRIQSGGDKE